MFTLGANLVNTIIKNLKNFIAIITVKNGVTFEAEQCTVNELTDLQNQDLLQSANFILIPNNSSEAKILPTLQVPTDDVRNLLFRSEGSTTNWGTTSATAVATSSIVDPAGTQRVVRVTEVAATNFHAFQQSIPNLYGMLNDVFTFSTYLRKGDGAAAPDIMQLSYGAGFANFNINTGVATASGSVLGASIQNAGSGWWRCIVSGSYTEAPTNNPTPFIGFVNNNPTATVRPSYLGATNRNVFVYGSQFELSLTASAYQPNLIAPRLPSGFVSFGSPTPGTYWINSSGSLQNTPYENIIYPSIRIATIQTGNTWRWIRTGLADTTTGQLAPDNSYNASKINLAGTVNAYYLSYQSAGSSVSGQSFPTSKIRTLILYVKQGVVGRYLGIDLRNGAANMVYNSNASTIKIDTSNGTLANNPTDYTITYASQFIGGGWYKVCINRADAWSSLSLTTNNTLATMTNSSDGVLIWGVQVLDGVYDINTPTYQRELGYSVPRLDYSGSSCPDYLIENSAINLLLRSEELNVSPWVTSSLTVTPNTEPAPNEELLSDTLTATADGASIRQSGTANTTNRTRIFSIYLKRKTGTGDVYLNTRNSASTTVTASLSTGSWTRNFVVDTQLNATYTVTSGAHTVTTAVNHGFSTGDAIRFARLTGPTPNADVSSITVTGPTTFTFSNGSATGTGTAIVYSNTGRVILSTNGDEVYAWGAQLELTNAFTTTAGRIPSSYIPTTTAQVTRAAESIVTNLSGSTSCSVYFELSKIGGENITTSNYIFIGNETNNNIATDGLALAGGSNAGIIYTKKENNGAVTTIANPLPYNPNENSIGRYLFITSGSLVNLWIDGSLLSTTTFANPDRLQYITLNGASNSSMRLSKITSWPTILTRQNIDSLFAYPYYDAGYTPVNYELQDVINRAYAEGFTLPSTTTLGYCDTLITNVKNEGMWDISDVFFNFAYNDTNLSNFARINWKNPNGSLGLATYVDSTVYELNGIRITNANTGYVDTNFNPTIATYNYTLNNACRLSIISARENGFYIDGLASNVQNQIQSGFNTNGGLARINAGTSGTGTNLTVNAQTGLTGVVRYDSTNITVIQRDVVQNTTQTSTALNNNTQWISRPGNFSFLTHAFYYMGSSVTNAQVQNLRTHYNTFLTSLGLSAIA